MSGVIFAMEDLETGRGKIMCMKNMLAGFQDASTSEK